MSVWQPAAPPAAGTAADDGEDPAGDLAVEVGVDRSPAYPGKVRLTLRGRAPGGLPVDAQAVLSDDAARRAGLALTGPPGGPAPAAPPPAVTDWRVFLRELYRVDDKFGPGTGGGQRAGLPDFGVPYLPYRLTAFMPLLADAVAAAPGRPARLLDAGCGPGTKLRLAEAMFGLGVHGIDVIAAHVDEANRGRAVPVAELADVRGYGGYGDHDIVLLNRPMEGDAQQPLERHVMTSMRPGAVLIHLNGYLDPHDEYGWHIVTAEEPRAVALDGVWQKPAF